MSTKKMWEILVPAEKNGIEIPVEYHRKWDAQVHDIAGGLTIFKPAIGFWVNPMGKVIKDKMIPVRIACTRKQIKQIMQMTLKHYTNEEAVLVYMISNTVLIAERE